MSDDPPPIAVMAAEVTPKPRRSNYPPQYAALVAGRERRALGDVFGLSNFGINCTRLEPGAISALLHRHALQDEFVYVLEGEPTLITDAGEVALRPGMCAGFKAGGVNHQIVNRTDQLVVLLEIGDRAKGDAISYPDADLAIIYASDGTLRITHKDGTPY